MLIPDLVRDVCRRIRPLSAEKDIAGFLCAKIDRIKGEKHYEGKFLSVFIRKY